MDAPNRPAEEKGDPMKCPRCSNVLTAIDYEGLEIETCSNCGGEWLDGDELGKVVRIRETRFDAGEQRAIAEAEPVHGIPTHEAGHDLNCPRDDAAMQPVNYGGSTGIIVDRCPTCKGMWVDAGELEKVQMLVESWKDDLPEDLKKYGPTLSRVEAEVDARDDIRVSRIPFINTLINGILDYR